MTPATAGNEGGRLFGSVLTFLIEPLQGSQQVTFDEECFHRLLSKVAMARAGVDDEGIRPGCEL